MTRRSWRRRSILIGAIIVVLSIGIVFASLPYIQPPTPPHGSIAGPESFRVAGGNSTYPGFNGLKLNITAIESFYIGVTVSGGTASFCVIGDQPYEVWAASYSQTKSPSFPSGNCILGPTPQTVQDILMFIPPSTGLWVVVALNSNPLPITVSFSSA